MGRLVAGGAVWRLAALAGLVATLTACDQAETKAVDTPPSAAKAALTVRTAAVETVTQRRELVATGSIVAWQSLKLGAEAGGLAVREVMVEEGDVVAAGQPLVRLDTAVMRAQRQQQLAAIDQAVAREARAKAELERYRQLRRGDNASLQTLEEREAEARVTVAGTVLARATLDEIDAKLAQARLLAPSAGIVAEKMVELGQVVQAGQHLLTLIRDGRLEVDLEVPETDLAGIRPGQTALVERDDGTTATATVRAVDPLVDARTRQGIVHVALPDEPGWRVGRFARARLQLDAVTVAAVPEAALVFRDGALGVFTLADGRARFLPVTTGPRQAGRVALTGGPAPGTPLVVDGAGFLADGDPVAAAVASAR